MSNKATNLDKFQNKLQNLKFVSNDLQRSIWRRWRNAAKETNPAFVIGCGRSGTSMLIFHLARSWHIELYNEARSSEAFTQWRLKNLDIIENLVERSYAPMTLFKPILDTYRIHDLFTRFPTTRVLFVFRHYPDVINSAMKRFGEDNWYNRVRAWIHEDFSEYQTAPPPQKTKDYIRALWKNSLSIESGTALYWLFHNQLYFDLNLHQNERVQLVRYESLVANPEVEFKTICDFFQIPFEAKIIGGVHRSSVKKNDPPDIDPHIQAECEKLWRELSQLTTQNNSHSKLSQ